MSKLKPLFIGLLMFCLQTVYANDFWQHYPTPVAGGIAFIPLANNHAAIPNLNYQGKRVLVVKTAGQWLAVVGIALNAKAGNHTLVDSQTNSRYHFQVQPKQYPAQYITLTNKRQVNPNKNDLKRIAKETKIINIALNSPWQANDNPLILPLKQPVNGIISSPFGLKRFFNQQARKPHRGLDIAADKGTRIIAPSDGRVINIGHYFFNGKTIFLDHGQGLISMYCHMDKINVTTGQSVKQGEKIGEIGMTGRVTGPHLHWGVRLNQQWIDPSLLLEQGH